MEIQSLQFFNKERLPESAKTVFSILIPTWNNLEYIQLCVESIQKNSAYPHQIILIINEGIDGTSQWAKEKEVADYVLANENIGICFGLNSARKLILSPYVMYMNDDMYVLPSWDVPLVDTIIEIPHKMWMLSATMIEGIDTGNQCVVVRNFGSNPSTFNRESCDREYQNLVRNDWAGSTWPPNVMPLELWDLVGGMSVEFSPGMYSDPDLSHKLFLAGVRYFKGVGSSLVYHFGSKSTGRIRKNKGRLQFLRKWNYSANYFLHSILHLGEHFQELPKEPPKLPFAFKLKYELKLIRGRQD